jgi:hypothetical protein
MPVQTISTEIAPVYQRLAELPGGFAVLDVPLGVRDGQFVAGRPENRHIFAQTVHHHPIVSGMVSRLAPETWDALLAAPVIGTLLQPTAASDATLRRDRAEGPAFFARWRIDAVVLHPSAETDVWRRYVETVLPVRGRERFADGTELLWLRGP